MVTKEQYESLLNDRPRKFTPSQVNFHKAAQDEPICIGCIHWYSGMAMGHNVCEIMRPKSEEVPWDWTCMFNTRDGETFLLFRESDAKDDDKG